jgi:hypothetical protein
MLATRGLGRWFLAVTVGVASGMASFAAAADDSLGLLGQGTAAAPVSGTVAAPAQARVDRFYRTVFAIHAYVSGHYWYGQRSMNYPLVENPMFAWNLREEDRQDLGLTRRELAAARLGGGEHQARARRLDAAVGDLQNLMVWDLGRYRDVGWSGLEKARDRVLEATEACLLLRSPTGAVNWSSEETGSCTNVDKVLKRAWERRADVELRLKNTLEDANPVARLALQGRLAALQRERAQEVPDGVHRPSADPRLRAPQPRSLRQQLRDC